MLYISNNLLSFLVSNTIKDIRDSLSFLSCVNKFLYLLGREVVSKVYLYY